jgi:hypothetical protein
VALSEVLKPESYEVWQRVYLGTNFVKILRGTMQIKDKIDRLEAMVGVCEQGKVHLG